MYCSAGQWQKHRCRGQKDYKFQETKEMKSSKLTLKGTAHFHSKPGRGNGIFRLDFLQSQSAACLFLRTNSWWHHHLCFSDSILFLKAGVQNPSLPFPLSVIKMMSGLLWIPWQRGPTLQWGHGRVSQHSHLVVNWVVRVHAAYEEKGAWVTVVRVCIHWQS